MAAYQAALAGQTIERRNAGEKKTKPGTIAAVVASYFVSTDFLNLEESTRTTYGNVINRIREQHGDKRVALLGPQHIVKQMAEKSAIKSAANNWLKMMRLLMKRAISEGLRQDDPTANIKPFKIKSDGFPAWEDEDIAAFRAKHPLGSRARLAMELALGTIQRRGDIVRLGRQHMREGTLSFKQKKTGQQVDIPVLPELQAALDAVPADQMTFLQTEFGKPFVAQGFGNWFRDVCNEAGVKKSAHGLRKAGATRLAEHGCTDHEIMAWGGWTSLTEVQRYTKRANRKRLAVAGAEKLKTETKSGQPA